MHRLYALALGALAAALPLASAASAQDPSTRGATEGYEVEPTSTPVRFDTLVVEGRGANTTVTFSYTALEAGEVAFRLHAVDEKKPGQSPETVAFSRTLVEGQSGTEQVRLRIIPNRNYTLMVTAEGNLGGEIATRHIGLRSVGSEVRLFDPWTVSESRRDLVARAAREGDLPRTSSSAVSGARTNPDGVTSGQVTTNSAARTVRIRGKLETLAYPNNPYTKRGVYGMEVWLFFRRPGAPFVRSELVRHSGLTTRGVHYDILDEEGNFSFEFQTNDHLTPFSEVAVVPSLLSPTAWITNGPSSNIEYYDPYTGEYEDFLTPGFGGVSIPIPSSGSIDVYGEGNVDRAYGPVFRYMELSKEIADREYGGARPFSLPFAGVEMIPGSGGGAMNYMTGGINIYLDGGNNPTVIAHEYGHYVMYNMYDQSANRYTLRNHNLREGWALFYSLATRAYAAETYGDVYLSSQNVETRAYPTTSGGTTRYSNVYRDKYDYAAIGALLWSLYDTRSTTPFEYGSSSYNLTLLGDNDDVNGYRRDVWESVRTTGASIFDEAGIVEVTATFRDRVPGSVRSSVDDAFDFFLCPNFGESGGCSASSLRHMPTRRPRPVQASNLTGQKSSSTSASLTWDRNVYNLSSPYANAPTGYRIYRNSSLVATVSNTTTSYTYTNAGGVNGTYRVTAYNAAGESTAAPTALVGVLTSISGPSLIPAGQQNSWTANVSGGSGTTTYKWYWDGVYTGVTSQTFSGTSFTDFNLRVDVTRGAETASASMYVTVYGDGGCVPEPGEILCTQPALLQPEATPDIFAVRPPQPNPARGEITIEYDLPEGADVSVVVYDVAGREVARPVDGYVAAGYREARLDGSALPAGVYIVRVQAAQDVATQRVTVIR